MSTRVMAAMSGGVDSSVAAALLVQAGHEVVGATLELIDSSTRCHIADARYACDKLGIPHQIFDARELFRRQIIDSFLAETATGLTPSPCVHCNARIKFGWLMDRASEHGCELLATGHYARIAERDGRRVIRQGTDQEKDQSYFLFALSQDQLAHALFPLGEMTKTEVRGLSQELALLPGPRPESRDLCFLAGSSLKDFIRVHLPELEKPGPILSIDGQELGRHQGACRYTIGQRQGLGLHGGPWYVVELRHDRNEVVVGNRDQACQNTAELRDVSWLIPAPEAELRCRVCIRYNHRPAPATVKMLSLGRAEVTFDEPQFAITPGQAAVFYHDDLVLGGAWII